MKMKVFISVLLLVFLSGFDGEPHKKDYKKRGAGIIVFYWDDEGLGKFLPKGEMLKVYNLDDSLYGYFTINADGETVFNKHGVITTVTSRLYDNESGLIIMDAVRYKSGYKVYMDNGWKYINKSQYYSYMDWEKFLSITGIVPKSGSVTRVHEKIGGFVKKSIQGAEIDQYSFNILEIEGEWVYVECDSQCASCGSNGTGKFTGWIQWKDGDDILVDIRHSC